MQEDIFRQLEQAKQLETIVGRTGGKYADIADKLKSIYTLHGRINKAIENGSSSQSELKNFYGALADKLKDIEKAAKNAYKAISVVSHADTLFKKIPGGTFLSQFSHYDEIKKKLGNNIFASLQQGKGVGSGVALTFSKITTAIKFAAASTIILFSTFELLKVGFKRWKELQLAAENFRKELGLSRNQTVELDASVRVLTRDYAYLGVTTESAYKALSALGSVFNGNQIAIADNVVAVSLLAARIGISEETSAKVLQNFMGLSSASSDVAKQNISIVLALGQMPAYAGLVAGVMTDIANASDNTLSFLRGSSAELIKGSFEARKLGTNIEAVGNSASHLLNFQQSLNDEQALSVVLGKNINLQGLRQLAWNGNLAQLADAQVSFLTSIGGLQDKNYIQVKAIAEATGLTVGDLTKMAAQQKYLLNAGPGIAEAFEKARKAAEGTTLTGDAFLIAQTKQLNYQSQLTELTNKWHDVLVKIADLTFPIINKAFDYLNAVLPAAVDSTSKINDNVKSTSANISKIVVDVALLSASFKYLATLGTIILSIKSVGNLVSKTLVNIINTIEKSKFGIVIETIFTRISNIFSSLGNSKFVSVIKSIGNGLSKAFEIIGRNSKLFSTIFKVFSFLAKGVAWVAGALLGIDEIIFAISFVVNLFSELNKHGKGFTGVLKAIGAAIYDTILQPFVDAYKWIAHFFVGNSPSVLGLGIVRGIESIGGILYNALTTPFRLAWEFATSLFSGNTLKNLITHPVNTLKSIGSTVLSAYTGNNGDAAIVGNSTNSSNLISSSVGGTTKDNVTVVADPDTADLLRELISLLKSGGVRSGPIYLDGKRLTAGLTDYGNSIKA